MVNNRPLVSVIVPIYNVEKYLAECVRSIVAQTYQNVEVILVDDGSTDTSGKIADELAKKYPQVFCLHKKNGGLSDARNVGMRHANGEYVTFVDSDDYIAADFVSTLVKAIADTRNTEIAQCDNTRNEKKLGDGNNSIAILSGKNAFIELMRYRVISPTVWGKLYKKSLFADNGLEFPVGRLHEDTAILYKLVYTAKNVVCVARNYYYYRKNDNSIMTTNYDAQHYTSVLQYLDELDEFIVQNNIAIDGGVLALHKKLRILSILNKMAAKKMDRTEQYRELLRKCSTYACSSVMSNVGMVLVKAPLLLRYSQLFVPFVRKTVGKV